MKGRPSATPGVTLAPLEAHLDPFPGAPGWCTTQMALEPLTSGWREGGLSGAPPKWPPDPRAFAWHARQMRPPSRMRAPIPGISLASQPGASFATQACLANDGPPWHARQMRRRCAVPRGDHAAFPWHARQMHRMSHRGTACTPFPARIWVVHHPMALEPLTSGWREGGLGGAPPKWPSSHSHLGGVREV